MRKQHHLNIPFKARYYTSGELNENTKFIWFVFHGYGQLAEYFIRNFYDLSSDHFIIAPEGLSRYYLTDNSGRVGASWMTKEDRLTDIQNQITYLNQMYKTVEQEIENGAKLIVLGFSQGNATAMRWIVNQNISPFKLLLWAGTIPPDLKSENENINLSKIDTIILKGDTDPYNGSIFMKNMDDWLKIYRINYRLVNYSGGHSIHIETLKQMAASF